jgi:predicted branched-subunit amino acid permease
LYRDWVILSSRFSDCTQESRHTKPHDRIGCVRIVAVLPATTVLNLRYVLFAATMSPHLRQTRLPLQAILAYSLTDETFAINIADRRAGTATGASMAGVGLISLIGWVLGTLIGATLSGFIGDPASWGLDFAMPAMFSALLIALAENRRQAAMGVLAGAFALMLPLLAGVGVTLSTGWIIIISSMTAATIGAVTDR